MMEKKLRRCRKRRKVKQGVNYIGDYHSILTMR
jgi:hypothetical protein